MLTSRNTGGFAATGAPEGFDLEDFESAGLRVVRAPVRAEGHHLHPGRP